LNKPALFSVIILLSAGLCRADTFTHRKTGEVFHGYATSILKGSRTLVRVGAGRANRPRYVDLGDYDVQWNFRGRKNQVVVLPVKEVIAVSGEVEAFEQEIGLAANRGPLLIVVEIDVPGGRADLSRRMCNAITRTGNCRTVAFVSGGQHGGAYSAGALIALACEKVFMANDAAMGAVTTVIASAMGYEDPKSVYGETVGEKMISADRGYIATICERNNRPALLAKAMVDRELEVVEVVEDGNSVFVTPGEKKNDSPAVRVWSKKGSLLTLTASEAVKTGMADATAGSVGEIAAYFKLEDPPVFYSTAMAEARFRFEEAELRLRQVYGDIDFFKKEADSIRSQVVLMTREYNRLNRSDYWNREIMMQDVAEARDRTILDLLAVLDNLLFNYRAVLALKVDFPDLPVERDAVEEEINSAQVLYRRMQAAR
jgi:membrane-bound serine protease (ClpP class)